MGIFVKRMTVLRRRPIAGYAVVVLALALMGVAYAAFAPSGDRSTAQASTASTQDVAKGKQVFNQTCASCHGFNADGTKMAPSLVGVGAAAVDFQVSTGRMPAQNPGVEQNRRKPVLNPQQTRQVAAYIASLGGGPAIPTRQQYDPKGGNLAVGGQMFNANCAQCHNFAGSGGALTNGQSAPSLKDATPQQIYEAMLTGPAAMPKFPNSVVSEQDKRAIIHYVRDTQTETNPGGNGLGRVGPVTEGIVGWLAGIGLIVAAAIWITAKQRGND